MKRKETFYTVFISGFLLGFISFLSAEVQIGQSAPDFSLPDLEGTAHKLSQYEGKIVVLEWANHDCPFCAKHYKSGNMQRLQKTYTEKGVIWLTLNSSASGKQGNYSAEKWKELTASKGAVPTAVLLDPQGNVGRLYGAQTTPHLFIIDPKRVLVYQGAIDDIPSTDVEDVPGAKNYIEAALNDVLDGRSVQTASTKSYGCSVKY